MAKGWAAARLRLRSEVRTTRAGLALLVAVIALSAGVTMAAAAGARRSDTAYERFRVWAHDSDITVSGCDCPDQVHDVFARLRAAPFVLDSVRMSFAEIAPELPDGTRASFLAFLPVIDIEGRLGRDLPRVKVLHGRLPSPAAADEVAVGLLTAERFHLSVGDELRLQAPDAQGHPYLVETARIAGIYAAPGELPSASGAQANSFLMTAAFAHAFPHLVDPSNDTVLLRLRPGTTRAEAQAFIDSLGVPLDINDAADLTSGIERTVRIETIALLVLGLVIAVVGLVVVGQMLRRQSIAERDEGVTYSALGCDRGDALRLGLLRGVTVGATGTALGVIVAVAMSPLFPVGIGRIADPDVGLHADVLVLAVGAAAALASVALLGVLTGASTVRSGRRVHLGRGEPSTLWPLPASRPPVLAGLYLALPRRAGGEGRLRLGSRSSPSSSSSQCWGPPR
jgi:putative ABC transport system permease protein